MADHTHDEHLAETDSDETISAGLNRLASVAERIEARLRPVEHRSLWNVVGTVAIIVLVVVASFQAKSNGELTEQVRDCIDPSGQCYRDSRSRTGEVERRILADQARRSEQLLSAVCAHIAEQGQTLPGECRSLAETITPGTTAPR